MVVSMIFALLAVLTEKPPSARASAPCGGVQGVYLCNGASPGLFDICIGDQKYTMSCPGGLHFNARTQVCDWPQNADCGKTPPAASLPSSPTWQRVQKGPDSSASDLSSRVDSFVPPVPVDDDRNSNDDIYLHDDDDDEDIAGHNFKGRYEHSDFAATDRPVTDRDREVKDLREDQESDLKRQHNVVADKPSASYDSSSSKQSGFRTLGGYTGRRTITPRRLESHERGESSSVSSNSQPTPSSGGRTNPYLARGLKHREMMLRQKEQNDKTRQGRVSDDGYNRFYNSNRKAALKNQSGTTSAQYPQQKREFGDEKKDNDNSIMTHDTQKQAPVASKTNEDNIKYLNKNQGSRNSDVHVNRNNHNGEESNDLSHQNSIQATDDSASSASNVRSSDRFGLANYPWWTSKSSSFSNRSSSSSSSPSRSVDPQQNLPQRQSSARMSRERGISSKQTSRSSNRRRTQAQQQQKQELGLRPFYQPLAAASSSSSAAASSGPSASASAAAASSNVPPQQALSARSITAAAAAAPKRTKKPTKTGKCSPETCKLPDCFCVGTDIPGGLKVKDTPMMVMLTFDDSVNVANYDYFTKIFGGELRNPNGCPIKGTFYVSGDATQYHFVEKLYKMGQEIASHSVSHRSPTTYWATAGYDGYVEEIEGMRKTLAEKSKIPRDQIKGMRVPFLQVGGDDQYQMLEDYGFTYDTSMVTGHLYRNDDPPVWPFTLDYAPSSKHCSLTPCPTKSYPGLWEVPLVRWYGSNRLACAMPDGCTIEPGQQGTLRFLEDNFRRHYDTNKSPLGIFLHASWFRRKDGNLEGLLEFLQRLSKMDDVWVVSVSQVIDWIRSPSPLSALSSLPSWACR